MSKITSCLYNVPIFNHLDDQIITTLTKQLNHTSLQKGEFLYHAGDTLDALYVVNAGKIRIYRLNDQGNEQLVRILYPGDFIGEWSLFTEKNKSSNEYAQALENTQICVLHNVNLQSILKSHPTVAIHIISEMAQQLDQMANHLLSVTSSTVENRILEYLLTIEPDSDNIREIPMTRKVLATYLGTTPETLSRRFNTLQTAGILTVHSPTKIEIINENI